MIHIQSGYSPTPDLTHARIGWENLSYGKTPTASSSAAGFPAIAATYPTTFEFWKPTAVPATWAIDCGWDVQVDYLGLVGDFAGATVAIQSSPDNSTWTTHQTETIMQRVSMFLFSQVTARYWRILVSDVIPSVACVYFGKSLAMQRRIYQGHSPLTLSRETELSNNRSEGGQYLGRSIVRTGVQTSASWSHLTAQWYRSEFDPFVVAARTAPFFMAWRPSQYPQEMGFVWTDGDIAPSNTGPRDMMSVDLTVRGLYNTGEVLEPGLYDLSGGRLKSFTRASTATYIDGAGVLQTAAVDVPRFQDGQLLVEGAATNLVPDPHDITAASWSVIGSLTRTSNTTTAPDGSMTAGAVVFVSGEPNDRIDYQTPIVAESGQSYTYSVWLKGSGTVEITINTTTGLGGSDELTVNLSPTWTRYSVSVTYGPDVTGNVRIHGLIIRAESNPSVDFWNAQLVTGLVQTSDIPAGISTRAADIATIAR
jgi:hypothetical protein